MSRAKRNYGFKPGPAARLNGAHPLAAYLVEGFFCREQAGTITRGIVQPSTTAVLAGSATWERGGLKTSTGTTDAFDVRSMPAYLKLQPPITIVWQGRSLGTQSTNANVFGCQYDSSNGSPFNCYRLMCDGSHNFFFATNNNSTFVNVVPNEPVLSGLNQAAFSCDGVHADLLINGKRQTGLNCSNATIGYSATSVLGFGAIQGYGIAGNFTHDFGLIFNRVLTHGQMQMLLADPYALLEPPRGRSRSTASVQAALVSACLVSQPVPWQCIFE